MIFKRFHETADSPTYLVGDEELGLAVLIDPRTDVEPYLAEAEARGLTVRHAISTRGRYPVLPLLELQSRAGTHIHGSHGPLMAGVNPLFPGSSMTLGRLRVQVDPIDATLAVYDLTEREPELLLVAGRRSRAI